MQRPISAYVLASMLAGALVHPGHSAAQTTTVTPITHLVIIFQENVAFDHYFGTYPHATNPAHEPPFVAAAGTPSVNGYTYALLHKNPNDTNHQNGAGASNPFRLDRSQAATASMDHDYLAEQKAFDKGKMDLFPKYTGKSGPPSSIHKGTGLVMGYYDGNTVTAYWNYAQRFAMSDNFYGTTFGPSTVGAINLISGQTNGVIDQIHARSNVIPDGGGGYTVSSSPQPIGDVCAQSSAGQIRMSGQNVGDLLNSKGITWGFFAGGFDLTMKNPNGTTGCKREHTSTITKSGKPDYLPQLEPFQFYESTQNLTHIRPTSPATVGQPGDPANHQYDIHDFYDALSVGNFPAVSILKAPSYQDGHSGFSDPLDEQTFVVGVLNLLQQQSEWANTAVIITYDDSDGWYDHQIGPTVNQSSTSQDALTRTGQCGNGVSTLPGVRVSKAEGRCGYGPRLPLLMISPYARPNFVDHTVTDQTSILRFIEDNWVDGQRIQGSFDALAGPLDNLFDFIDAPETSPYLLDPSTGEVQ